MGKLSRSESDKKQSDAYKKNERWKKNREARLEKHIERHPEDKQAERALDRGIEYRRKPPRKSVWSAHGIKMAQIYKEAGRPRKFLFNE